MIFEGKNYNNPRSPLPNKVVRYLEEVYAPRVKQQIEENIPGVSVTVHRSDRSEALYFKCKRHGEEYEATVRSHDPSFNSNDYFHLANYKDLDSELTPEIISAVKNYFEKIKGTTKHIIQSSQPIIIENTSSRHFEIKCIVDDINTKSLLHGKKNFELASRLTLDMLSLRTGEAWNISQMLISDDDIGTSSNKFNFFTNGDINGKLGTHLFGLYQRGIITLYTNAASIKSIEESETNND